VSGAGIHLWWFRQAPGWAREDAALALLDEGELARYRGFASPEAARFFAFRRAVRRLVLAEATGLSPERLEFEDAPEGKPRLSGSLAGFGFSASDSGRMGVVAVCASAPVGADLELAREIDAIRLAARILSPAERLDCLRTPPGRQAELILRAWTAKEALVKAMGLGVDLAVFRQIEVPLAWPSEDWHPARLGAALAAQGSWQVCTRMLPGPALASIAAPVAAEVLAIDAGPLLARNRLG